MLSWLANGPARTRVASLNTIFFDGGRSSITFNDHSDPYLVINHLPPASDGEVEESKIPGPGNCALAPPLHWHYDQTERFHVLEGKARFYLNGRKQTACVGDVVTIPKQAFHTFRNASKQDDLVIEFVLDPMNRDRDEAFFSTCPSSTRKQKPN